MKSRELCDRMYDDGVGWGRMGYEYDYDYDVCLLFGARRECQD